MKLAILAAILTTSMVQHSARDMADDANQTVWSASPPEWPKLADWTVCGTSDQSSRIAIQAVRELSGPDNAGLAAERKARDRGDVKALQTAITNTRKKTEETKSFEEYIRLALLYDWMCEAAESNKNDQLVKEAAQAGVAVAETAVKLRPNSSQAHQLLADLLGQLAPHVTGGGMKYGQRSTNEADKAIELDPKNADAYVTRAISYLYTPEAFGGNKQKAFEFLSKATELDPQADSPHIWLSLYHLETGKLDEALREINEARRLNAGRKFSEFVFEQVSASKKGGE